MSSADDEPGPIIIRIALKPWEWTIRMAPGAICRSIMWGEKEVAYVNPRGDFDDATEKDLAAGFAYAPQMHMLLRDIQNRNFDMSGGDLIDRIKTILRGINTVDVGEFQEIGEPDDLPEEDEERGSF